MGVLRLFWFSLPITTQAANPASLEWRTVPSSDGVLTVGMPGEPEVESRDEQDSVGPTQVVKQRVGIDDNTILFSLVERHYLDEDVQFDRGPFLDGTAESTLAQSKGELVGESEVHRGDLVGKAISIEMPQEYTVSMQFFLIGRSVYQLKVVTPNAMADSPIVRRFFESLEVDKSRIGTVGDRVSATYGEFSRAD
ncbi:hypothetical protein V5E97_37290 [Singulisphaera sp. Ch08]|uniref:DUF3857 domain-containing protein n=1 Tax=Singulisphaera sp. Ch08 TaxID=3120278 RepID=A0AAU7CFS6_9BACT